MTRRLALLALPALLLAACGKRPGALRPPEGSTPGQFPGPYPNPRHDQSPQAQQAPGQ